MKKSPTTLSAHDLRHCLNDKFKETCKNYDRNNIHIILDNVVDAYNIGSAFRIADSIFAKKVWICGENSVTPLDRQVQKSSVNTSELIEWEVIPNTLDVFNHFNDEYTYYLAVEKINNSSLEFRKQKLNRLSTLFNRCKAYDAPFCIIIGSESFGINKEILNHKVNGIVEIPMYGVNNSMNVINALAIVCSHLFDN